MAKMGKSGMNLLKVKSKIGKRINPNNKYYFIDSIVKNGKLFDIGCGNNSPFIMKTLRPDVYYVGLDVGDYNQTYTPSEYADEFVVTDPAHFHLKIAEYANTFDSAISSHNLEHCDDYLKVTLAMIQSLKKGGTAYISFPCEESVNFPHRRGTLNFFDDCMHSKPIAYSPFISFLKQNGMSIMFARKRYRPLIPFILGLFYEPISRLINKLAPFQCTWALYGFETVIVAKKE